MARPDTSGRRNDLFGGFLIGNSIYYIINSGILPEQDNIKFEVIEGVK